MATLQITVPQVEVNMHLECPETGRRFRVGKLADDDGWILISNAGSDWFRKGIVEDHLQSGVFRAI